jgi:hypothetical protein
VRACACACVCVRSSRNVSTHARSPARVNSGSNYDCRNVASDFEEHGPASRRRPRWGTTVDEPRLYRNSQDDEDQGPAPYHEIRTQQRTTVDELSNDLVDDISDEREQPREIWVELPFKERLCIICSESVK